MMNTIRVVIMVSRRVGHVTFSVSERTSWRNLNGLTLAMLTLVLGHMLHGPPASQAGPTARRIYTQKFRKSPSPDLRASSSLAGVEGLEPPTPGFGDRCSSH